MHPFSTDAVTWTHLGRGALHLAARVLGLEGREVLVPAYHHGVEVDALLAAGAHPGFYAVGTRWTVDVEDLERRIGPRTGGLVLTHFAGFPGPVQQLRSLADRHGLVLIEDCAQALRSMDGASPVGSTGDAAVFSLRKTLPVPHGGALVFNGARSYQLPPLPRPPAAPTLRALCARLLLRGEFRLPNQGGALRRLGCWFSRHFRTGFPRIDAQGRIDRHQLELGSSPLVNELLPGVCPLFYPLWVPDRHEALARLRVDNVEANAGWRSFHPRCDGGEFPEAALLREHVLELPCHQDLGPAHVAHEARAVLRALRRDRARRWRAAEG